MSININIINIIIIIIMNRRWYERVHELPDLRVDRSGVLHVRPVEDALQEVVVRRPGVRRHAQRSVRPRLEDGQPLVLLAGGDEVLRGRRARGNDPDLVSAVLGVLDVLHAQRVQRQREIRR